MAHEYLFSAAILQVIGLAPRVPANPVLWNMARTTLVPGVMGARRITRSMAGKWDLEMKEASS